MTLPFNQSKAKYLAEAANKAAKELKSMIELSPMEFTNKEAVEEAIRDTEALALELSFEGILPIVVDSCMATTTALIDQIAASRAAVLAAIQMEAHDHAKH